MSDNWENNGHQAIPSALSYLFEFLQTSADFFKVLLSSEQHLKTPQMSQIKKKKTANFRSWTIQHFNIFKI